MRRETILPGGAPHLLLCVCVRACATKGSGASPLTVPKGWDAPRRWAELPLVRVSLACVSSPCFLERGTMTSTRTRGSGGRSGTVICTGMALGEGRQRGRRREAPREPPSAWGRLASERLCLQSWLSHVGRNGPAAKFRSRFRFPSLRALRAARSAAAVQAGLPRLQAPLRSGGGGAP